MARAQTTKQYNTFNKGFNTEANQVNFPEGYSKDEANMLLNTDGSRQRRLGMSYEANWSALDTGISLAAGAQSRWQLFRWDNVDNDPNTSFGVVRFRDTLFFVDLFSDTLSVLVDSISIPLNNKDADVSFTTLNGQLICASAGLTYPILVTHSNFTWTTQYLRVQTRDFWGVDDGLDIDTRPTSLSTAHKYNLFNQGWTQPKLDQFSETDSFLRWVAISYITAGEIRQPRTANGYLYAAVTSGDTGVSEPVWPTTIGGTVVDGSIIWSCWSVASGGSYPSNADIMSLGEKTDGSWDKDLIKDYLVGNTPAPKGHYIIEIFGRSATRHLASGLLPTTDYDAGSFSQVATHFSRVFYSGVKSEVVGSEPTAPNLTGYIFFSRVVRNTADLTVCYQEADPTSETISDLVDTDGGYIVIPEMSNVKHMVPFNDQLVIFAENGVWSIRSEGGFTALNYNIVKVTDVGVINQDSIVQAENNILYWSKAGIYALSLDSISTQIQIQDITVNTIKSYYNEISTIAKANVKGYYDPQSKIVGWLYNANDDYDGSINKDNIDTELRFDLQLEAFYPYTISTKVSDSPHVVGAITTPNYITNDVVQGVYVGNEAVQASGVDVIVTTPQRFKTTRSIKYLATVPSVTNYTFTFALYSDTTFHDWDTEDYSSYVITGDEIMGDIMRSKHTPYFIAHLRRTETGFDDSFNPVNPSSCLVQGRWDWSNDIISNRWTKEQQAYRYKQLYVPSSSLDTFNTGFELITTKSKLRGKGKALRVSMKSEEGKDMHIVGWALFVAGQTQV
jgi:hypothetical protein